MKTISRHELATTAKGADVQRGICPLVPRLIALVGCVRQGYLQVFGIPDYERYKAHMTSHHAGEPVLSRREFFAWSIDRKYGRSGPRCC